MLGQSFEECFGFGVNYVEINERNGVCMAFRSFSLVVAMYPK